MSIWGGDSWGGSSYGGPLGVSPTPGPVVHGLVVQPNIAFAGDNVLIASYDSNLVDSSRDDDFSSDIDPLVWSTSTTGVVTSTFDNTGLNIEVQRVSGGGSYSITSVDSYVDGDITLNYEI